MSESICIEFKDRPLCFIDPRYDWDEIIAEIENLELPIPSAFLDDSIGQGA